MTRTRFHTLVGLAGILCLVAVFYVASYRGVLFAPGSIYQNWDQTIPPYPSQISIYGSISADAWSSIFEFGSPASFTGISLAFDMLMRRGLAFLGGATLARWHFLLYALTGAAGFWLLCRRMGLGFWPSAACCLLSQFNPRTYTLVVSGHGFETGFALMLAPWAVYFADRARSARGAALAAWALGCGMAAGLAFSSTPIGIVLTASFLFIWWVASSAVQRSLRPLAVLVLAGAVVLGVQAHWLLPGAATGSAGVKYNQRMEDVRAHYMHVYKDFSSPLRQAMLGHTDNLGMGTEQAYPVEGAYREYWTASALALLGLALLGLLAPVSPAPLKWFGALCLLGGFWMLAGAQTVVGRAIYEGVLARVSMVFYLMARPMRWLPVYQAGLALLVGLGLEAVRRRSVWRSHRWPSLLAGAVATVAVGVYLWPWWSGGLTTPRGATTQTMSLMLQQLPPEERDLVRAINDDPGDYRVTVLPTVAGPTGDVPEPPHTSLTRNFGMLGKDSLLGPTYVGQPYGRFLLSMLHRPQPFTDAFGRLLGLGAVRRVLWDRDVPHLSYSDFGWMPRVKRGPETLSDPGDAIARFLAAQRDLRPDAQWSRGPFTVFTNADELSRVRTARRLCLAAGGAPLLAALAELPENRFTDDALVFGTDAEGQHLEGLGQAGGGLYVAGNAWPELLLPWLPANAWLPAAGPSTPAGWGPLGECWDKVLWFEGSPLNGAALASDGPARLELPLPASGAPLRLLARVGATPGQWGPSASYARRELLPAVRPSLLDRGWRWVDLGLVQPQPGQSLVFEAPGRGAVVSGVLAAPEAILAGARASLDAAFPPEAGTVVAAEAESAAVTGSGLAASTWSVPLLAELPGVSVRTEGLRAEGLDGTGAGTLAAEGEAEGLAEFELAAPWPVGGFTLEWYPRLFGDKRGIATARAEYALDDGPFRPLFELSGRADDRWEDVYGRAMRLRVDEPCARLRLRVHLRQAQLVSLANAPNTPMRVVFDARRPFRSASMGQAVALPAAFDLSAPRAGRYQVRARLVGSDGARWIDAGTVDAGPDAPARLALPAYGPDEACDLLALEQPAAGAPQGAEPLPDVALARRNQGRYQADIPGGSGRVLLFSESANPRWKAAGIQPIKAYGFMNAYVTPNRTPWEGGVEIAYDLQGLREAGGRVTGAVWAVSALACAVCALAARRKKAHGEAPRSTDA